MPVQSFLAHCPAFDEDTAANPCDFSAAEGQTTVPLNLQDVHGGAVTVVLRSDPPLHRLGPLWQVWMAGKAHGSHRYCFYIQGQVTAFHNFGMNVKTHDLWVSGCEKHLNVCFFL